MKTVDYPMASRGVQKQKLIERNRLLGKRCAKRTKMLEQVIGRLRQERQQMQQTTNALRDTESGYRLTIDRLRESEERYKLANKATNDVVWDWDIVNDTQKWNESGTVIFGWTDIVAHPQSALWWVDRIHSDDRQRVHDGFFAVLQDPAKNRWQDEYLFRKADGNYAIVQDRGYLLRDVFGKPVRMIGAMLDITERRQAQDALQRLNRDLRALSSCNQALVRVQDENDLLNEICRIIHNDAGYRMVWVGYIEQDSQICFRKAASAGDDNDNLREIYTHTNVGDFWCITRDQSVREQKTVIIQDFANQTCLLGQLARNAGLRSVIALPLFDDKISIFGALLIYSTEANGFSSDDIRLLEELSGDLSFGINALRSQLKRKEAEYNLHIALREKESLIQELYHRTRNNMQVISALLQMHELLIDDPKLIKIVDDMRDRIQAIALVHEKLYQSKKLSKINLTDYIDDLALLLFNGYPMLKERVDLMVDAEPVEVTIDIGVPCGLVVTELLTNCFKYAFPDERKGMVQLTIRRIGETQIVLCIADNGIGRGMQIDIAQLRTLGLPVVESIVKRQLQGSMELDTRFGICWNIRFKADIYEERV
jgi:PAS domain S-box-containing protein